MIVQIPAFEKRNLRYGFGKRWYDGEWEKELSKIKKVEAIKGSDTIVVQGASNQKFFFEEKIRKIKKREVQIIFKN